MGYNQYKFTNDEIQECVSSIVQRDTLLILLRIKLAMTIDCVLKYVTSMPAVSEGVHI